MTIFHQPSIFVSSTCYDLAQLRQNLHAFIESFGMIPVLSEFNSFPVDPNVGAIGNCLAGVKDIADIFILVVGGRYGSQTEGGRSFTNLEYLEAKAKGIPRYVFVQKAILAAFPIWQNNREGNFTTTVDSPKLFEFLESISDPKDNWLFPFESAQDIIDTLRKQFAYLFKDALDIRIKVNGSGLKGDIHELSGEAIAIAVQKPKGWEYRLLGQAFADEIKSASSMKMDLDYGIALGKSILLNDVNEFISWLQTRLGEIQALKQALEKIVNVALPKAIGAPGEPGNVDEIVYSAQRLGQVYRRLLEWSLDFKQVQVSDEFAPALSIIGRFPQNMISELEQFSCRIQEIRNAILQYEKTKEPQTIDICLTLTCPDMSDLEIELQRLLTHFGLST